MASTNPYYVVQQTKPFSVLVILVIVPQGSVLAVVNSTGVWMPRHFFLTLFSNRY